MILGNKAFDVKNHTYVWGILNVTPDSFYDGGEYSNIDAALLHVKKMIEEGADVIDVGGESTRPGYVQISEDEEIARVIPVIEKIKSEYNIPVSLDTYKAKVAKAGIEAGADLINDIWGLKGDMHMAEVIAKGNVSVCLCHNRVEHDYVNFLEDLFTDLSQSVNIALKAGIKEEKIILDPGIGFCKDTNENLLAMQNMDELSHLGFPWLLAASRKSVIGNTLNLEKGERLEGTLATTALAVMKGASFVRVHDIKENVRVIKMMEAIRDV